MCMWCEGGRVVERRAKRRRDTGRANWMFITPVSNNKASVFSLEYFSRLICVGNLSVDMCRVFAKSQGV